MIDLGQANEFIQGVYTDLDTLFDTRFAVLEQVDHKLALINLKESWSKRKDDDYMGITTDMFNQLYESRDLSVLDLAQPTVILETIKQWCFKALKNITGSPNGDKVVVFVNVWPYLISKQRAREMGSNFSKSLGDTVEIRMINYNPKEIDTETAAKYFSAMFIYDWDKWLESNTENGSFAKRKIPDVTLYAPKVFKTSRLSEQEKLLLNKNEIDTFDLFEMTAGPQIGIEFIDIAFFSNSLPDNYLDFYDHVIRSVNAG